MNHGRRLIGDFLPVNSVGEAAASEPGTKALIGAPRLWWA